MITFTGPKIAMLVASVSFLTIAGSVIAVSKVDSEILRQSHQKNTDIYGHIFPYRLWWRLSPKPVSFDIKDKTFKCKIEGESFDCLITKVTVEEVSKIPTKTPDTCSSTIQKFQTQTDIYKITGPRDKMQKWKHDDSNTKDLPINIQDKINKKWIQQVGMMPFFSVDDTIDQCINPTSTSQ